MLLRTGVVALIALAVMPSGATAAGCYYLGLRFHVAQNDSVSTTGVSTGGGACVTRFWAGGTNHFTSATIAARPNHGTLTEMGALHFRYKPSSGFKGADRYSLRVCGTEPAGSGCATLTYNITVR